MGSKIAWRPKTRSWSDGILSPIPARHGERFVMGLVLCLVVAASIDSVYEQVESPGDELAMFYRTSKGTTASRPTSTADPVTDGLASTTPFVVKEIDQLSSSAPSNSQRQLQATGTRSDATFGTTTKLPATPRSFEARTANEDSRKATPTPDEPSPGSKTAKDEKSKRAKKHIVGSKPVRTNDIAQANNLPNAHVSTPQPFFGFWGNNDFASQRARPQRSATGGSF
jgi:hypothetical protein